MNKYFEFWAKIFGAFFGFFLAGNAEALTREKRGKRSKRLPKISKPFGRRRFAGLFGPFSYSRPRTYLGMPTNDNPKTASKIHRNLLAVFIHRFLNLISHFFYCLAFSIAFMLSLTLLCVFTALYKQNFSITLATPSSSHESVI